MEVQPKTVEDQTFNDFNVPIFSQFTYSFPNMEKTQMKELKQFIKVQLQLQELYVNYVKNVQNSSNQEALENGHSDAQLQNSHFDIAQIQKVLYKPLVIVGPSGAGKGTLIDHIVTKYSDKFGFSVSYTTRNPRVGEVHGKNYYFVSKEEFQKKIENNDFIEYCQVHTNFYGTEKAQVRDFQKSGIIPLLDIDIQGAKKVYAAFPEANFIFICPPSMQELKNRLVKRSTDSEEQIQIRLRNAEKEISECLYSKQMIQYRIVNEDLNKSFQIFTKLIEALYDNELGLVSDQSEPAQINGQYVIDL